MPKAFTVVLFAYTCIVFILLISFKLCCSIYPPSLEPVQSSGVLIERASNTTIIITLNKNYDRSIHADELMVVWYDRDDGKHHLNSRIYFVNSTVDQIAIRISEEKSYTVAVFCNNSMYPWAIETFETIYKQGTCICMYNVEIP